MLFETFSSFNYYFFKHERVLEELALIKKLKKLETVLQLSGMLFTKKHSTSLAALGAFAHLLQCHTACNTTPPAHSKMAYGVWKYVKP